ncbi:MAG TPA: hypothetical protein VJV78_28580 [Polyangiales bacterium]|nr:hypothetical protein [Polyangiales bacterium]
MTEDVARETPQSPPLIRTHLRFGWLGLSLFVVLGIALEGLHAFKSSAYLGVGQETRRLMWTLAHAHGVGLSLVHLGFVASLRALRDPGQALLLRASHALRWATVLIPGGFFLGGVVTYEGDPGVAVFLVPIGALVLVISLVCVVWVIWSTDLKS